MKILKSGFTMNCILKMNKKRKPYGFLFKLLFNDFGFAAHIGTESLGNADNKFAIAYLKVVFEECDKHSRGSNNGVVEGVCKIFLAVCALNADTKAARLRVTEVGAGANLKILALLRRPRFNIIGLNLKVGKVARAALKGANGDIHRAEKLNGVAPHLVEPVHRLFGLTMLYPLGVVLLFVIYIVLFYWLFHVFARRKDQAKSLETANL